MSNIEFHIPYWGPFVMEAKVDQEFVDLLLKKGNESREKNLDYRENLAGVIENEYYYEDYNDWFIPKIKPYIEAYLNGVKTYRAGAKHQLVLDTEIAGWQSEDLWINYQKAKEYNPPHNHNADLSFVVYLQVPEEIKIDNEAAQGVAANVGPGMIVLDYGLELPFSNCRHCKFPEIGDILIFPAWLPHHVYAFTSDVERISVSGNITLEMDLNIMRPGPLPAKQVDL